MRGETGGREHEEGKIKIGGFEARTNRESDEKKCKSIREEDDIGGNEKKE